MSQLSVIIPSRTAANLVPCVAAVRKHEPEARIIVVDDGVDWSETPWPDDGGENLPFQAFMGDWPFVFARNVNIGIRAADGSDVILLNDDALLESPGGFSLMQLAAREYPEYGVISATANNVGNPAQQRMQGAGIAGAGVRGGLLHGLRDCPKIPGHSVPVVAFVCVLIPRSTIENLRGRAGEVYTWGLDERFVTYGWDDNDYCRQCVVAGLKIGIHDGCFVDHSKLTSTFRGLPAAAGDIEPGRKIYLDKWGTM